MKHELTLEDIAPIDLNKATKEELMLLPDVNEKTAEAILSLREGIHGFSNVYELLYVDELTQKQVAELIEFVTVGE
jgi:competence protein ComEA